MKRKPKIYRARPIKPPSQQKMKVKQCPLCLRWFATQSEKRIFCTPHHRIMWGQYNYLLRKREEGKIKEWEIGMLQRLENFIKKERRRVEAEIEAQRKGRERKKKEVNNDEAKNLPCKTH